MTHHTDAALLPCPFCGAHAETDFIPEHHSYAIECHSIGCAARVIKETAEDAVKAWNRRPPAAPVPLRKPTVAQVADAIGYHASAWDCVGPRELIDAILMLAAAPQPPEAGCSVSNGETQAAPVQLPEPVAYQWLSTDNFRISGGPVSGAYWNKLYTEQQVRELLAAHGIQEQST